MSVCLYDCPVATLENSLYGYVLRIHNIVLLFEIVLSKNHQTWVYPALSLDVFFEVVTESPPSFAVWIVRRELALVRGSHTATDEPKGSQKKHRVFILVFFNKSDDFPN